jgi:FAD/FMN-containing dehydrogenase
VTALNPRPEPDAPISRIPAGAHEEGALSCDPEAITSAADDFGHLVHRVPLGVARPGDQSQAAVVARQALAQGLPVIPRGAGHSVFGHGQIESGVVCDLTALNQIRDIQPDRMIVEAGARWSAVLAASSAHGLAPPVLTDYLELTVGGTLSAGGIGGASHQHGPQVDAVLELHILDPRTAELLVCSPDRNAGQFFAALAGHGGGGIITQATIPLSRAPQRVRAYSVPCADVRGLIANQLLVARDGRFDYLEGQIISSEGSGWNYLLEAGAFYSTAEPDDAALLSGLACDPAAAEIKDTDYATFCHRMVPGVRALAATGDWYRPHPWVSVFLPIPSVERYVAATLASLTPEQVGPLPMLLYPIRRGRVPAPALCTPQAADDGLLYSFSILRTVPADSESISTALGHNRELARNALRCGGTVYAISAIPAPAVSTL